jgi:hypothetical protein
MKRVLIGGFLSMAGTIWGIAVIIFAGNHLVSGWSTPPGRFPTTVIEQGMMFPFLLSIAVVLLGTVIMMIEYFKKD